MPQGSDVTTSSVTFIVGDRHYSVKVVSAGQLLYFPRCHPNSEHLQLSMYYPLAKSSQRLPISLERYPLSLLLHNLSITIDRRIAANLIKHIASLSY